MRLRTLGAVVAGLHDLVAPRRCLGCRRRDSGPVLCAWCEAGRRELIDPCPRCAAPSTGPHACWPSTAPVDTLVALYDYRGGIASAIRTAKLEGLGAAWPRLAAGLADRVADARLDVDVVTWVTTPGPRVRQRGVDHAEALARVVADDLGLPCRRLLDARAATGGDAHRARHALPASAVLLVDDIVTTGATLWSAAVALQAAGAGRIGAAVLARAGGYALGPHRPRSSPDPRTTGEPPDGSRGVRADRPDRR